MTATCPICHCVATEVKATATQATFRGGCVHLEIEGVGDAMTARFVRRESEGPKPRTYTNSAANEIAELVVK